MAGLFSEKIKDVTNFYCRVRRNPDEGVRAIKGHKVLVLILSLLLLTLVSTRIEGREEREAGYHYVCYSQVSNPKYRANCEELWLVYKGEIERQEKIEQERKPKYDQNQEECKRRYPDFLDWEKKFKCFKKVEFPLPLPNPPAPDCDPKAEIYSTKGTIKYPVRPRITFFGTIVLDAPFWINPIVSSSCEKSILK